MAGVMDGHFFISYSRIDGGEFALRLADELEAGPPSYGVWLDVRKMQPGQQDWDRQLLEAIQSCIGLLFVMSEDSVRDESGCKPEWVAGLRYRRPVTPVRLHSGAELPFRLSSRQFIDFCDSFDTGLAQLRKHLAWTGTPAGVMQDLRNRRADAEYELPRADPAQRRRIEEELDELGRRIEEQQRVVQSPRAVAQPTAPEAAIAMAPAGHSRGCPIDVSALVSILAPCLAALLAVSGATARGAVVGGELCDHAGRVWTELKPHVESKPAALKAAEDVGRASQDRRARAALELQLKELLSDRPALAEKIAPVMDAAQAAGLVATGARSVAVGGSVTGSVIVTGDGAVIRE